MHHHRHGWAVRLEARGLTHAYKRVTVLSGLSLTVEPGQIVGLLGPNGAGKSTALGIIAGQIWSGVGSVQLGTHCLDGLPTHRRVKMGLGFLPQEPSVFRDCTVRENLQLAAEGLGASPSTVAEQLQVHGLAGIADQRASELSGGERRRLELARCLVGRPSVLILDEPFSGVDPVGVEALQQTLKVLALEGMGLLITDHAVQATLSICDMAIILNAGSVMAEGCPETVAADPAVCDRYLGQHFEFKKLH
jgi:lipopolysaccharide export system ATP-binding protein